MPNSKGAGDMNERKLNTVLKMINENINLQRRNAPDSAVATDAREENRRLFALLDSHGIAPTGELHKAALA
jgi:hypothetical protein